MYDIWLGESINADSFNYVAFETWHRDGVSLLTSCWRLTSLFCIFTSLKCLSHAAFRRKNITESVHICLIGNVLSTLLKYCRVASVIYFYRVLSIIGSTESILLKCFCKTQSSLGGSQNLRCVPNYWTSKFPYSVIWYQDTQAIHQLM